MDLCRVILKKDVVRTTLVLHEYFVLAITATSDLDIFHYITLKCEMMTTSECVCNFQLIKTEPRSMVVLGIS